MSSSPIWGDPVSYDEGAAPLRLLRYLLKQMMVQFAAHGGCIALYDESTGQMRVRVHLRARGVHTHGMGQSGRAVSQRLSVQLENTATSSIVPSRPRPATQPLRTSQVPDDVEDVLPVPGDPFAVGMLYPRGKDLIGQVWNDNDAYALLQGDYIAIFHPDFHTQHPVLFQQDYPPTAYLAASIQEPTLIDEVHGAGQQPHVLGVVVLYQVGIGSVSGFPARQRSDALHYAERIALYLHNERLWQMRRRTSEYLQLLQDISTAFPTTVQIPELVKRVYEFTSKVVNVSSMMLTLYDRDTNKMYDVFAIKDGVPVEGLPDLPLVVPMEQRPMWWRVTHEALVERRRLSFSPLHDSKERTEYEELLTGTWGDQRTAESFLFLPMKMFKRVTGSLSISSSLPYAYRPEEIQVLETMLQIVTVSIENAKLYDRDRNSVKEAKRREEQAKQSAAAAKKREELLAAMNSALQSITSVLNMNELLMNFVRSATALVRAEAAGFFLLSPEKDQLIAQTFYAPTRVEQPDDESNRSAYEPPLHQEVHDELIQSVRIPFTGTQLEQRVQDGFFYLDRGELEDLCKICSEKGALFLQATDAQQMLFIPVSYQTDLLGLLALHTPPETHFYQPEQVGILLAICAQAAMAIRNAQLYEQSEEARAELERMGNLKDEFLITASHELRTPLSAVIGYSSMLKRSAARLPPEQIARYSTKILEAAQQLSELVGNMTEAANMGAGTLDKNIDLQRSPVQMRLVVEVACGIRVSIEQPIIRDIDPELWVEGDAFYIRQIIANLLDNAAKYSPSEGRIWVTAEAQKLSSVASGMPEDQIDHVLVAEQPDTPVVCVSVRDQGEGILPEDQHRIFEKFVRAARSLTTPVRGSGLGLYICRRYVEAMGGRLWLASSIPGEGSVFSFYLPRVDAPVLLEEQETSGQRTT